MSSLVRPVWRAACVAALACLALHCAPLSAQAWQRQQQILQQQRQMEIQRQQDMQRQQMQEQQRRSLQEQQRRIMQEQQRASLRQQAIAQQKALRQQGARIAHDNKPTGVIGSGSNARLTRQLTPGEIQRGFTGKVTTDGRALIKFQNRVFVVPASRVSGLSAKLAAQKQAQGNWSKQQWAGANASIKALVAQGAAARARQGGGGRGSGARVAANDNSMSANRIALSTFYKTSGQDPKEFFEKARGWDFAKPMRITTLKAGTELCQWKIPEVQGVHYAPCGHPPSRLGIGPQMQNRNTAVVHDRVSTRFVVMQDIQVLEGRARAIVDNFSIEGVRTPTEGGAPQYMVRKGDLVHVKEQP